MKGLPSRSGSLRGPGAVIAVTVIVFVSGLPATSPLKLPSALAAAEPTIAVERVSVSSSEIQGSAGSFTADIAYDGRYVIFDSDSTNLVPDDTNGYRDIFARNVTPGTTDRVSLGTGGTQKTRPSFDPSVSANGQYVSYETNETVQRVYLFNRREQTQTLVSSNSSGQPANLGSQRSDVSPDGLFVVFDTGANLVPEDNNGTGTVDVYVKNGIGGQTNIVSINDAGDEGNAWSTNPSVGEGATDVAFQSQATNLVPGDTNGFWDILVRDRVAGTTERVSVGSGEPPAQGNGDSLRPAITPDGRYVAFDSAASNLVAGDGNGRPDVFVHDRVTGSTIRASVDTDGGDANHQSLEPTISADGRYVAFYSNASDLVAGDDNGTLPDVFVRDMVAGRTIQVSLSATGPKQSPNGNSVVPAISADGTAVAFGSNATDLVSGGDANGTTNDIYLARIDWGAPPVPPGQLFGTAGIHSWRTTNYWADPVNTALGSFSQTATDVALPGTGLPFVLSRSYTSADAGSGALGQGWAYSLEARLEVDWNGDVVFRAEDGQRLKFVKNPDGSFARPPGSFSSLAPVTGGYELTRRDQVVNSFDADGKLTQVADRNGNALALAYDANARLSTVTDTAGRVITFTHDAGGLLTRVDLPDGRFVSYAYTGSRLTSATDLRGKTTTYAYDAGGRLASVTDPRGNTVVTNTYGPDGRVVGQTDALGNSATLAWDPATQTATMTDARGGVWKDVYDQNKLVKRIDPLGSEVAFAYDDDLNPSKITDARGKAWTMTYDARGNMLTRSPPAPFAFTESFAYDARNNLTSATDARGNATTFGYDADGNLIQVTEPGSVVTSFGRDPATGHLTSITDPRNKTTTFAYDASGNLTRIDSPLGNRTTMAYDAAGRMTALVEPRGNAAGATPADFRWTYSYDTAGNLLAETDPLGNTTAFVYDAAGNLTKRTDANNHATSYAYNAANELTTVTAPDLTQTTYAYDAAGNLTKRTDANNHETTYAYDAAGRLTGVTSPIGQHWAYAYDPNGNLTRVTDAAAVTTDYGYDELNRLVSINHSGVTPDVAFAYDNNGNRTQMTDGAGTETYAYDALDRLTSVTRGTDVFAYLYDAAGNLTRRTYPDGTVVDLAYDDDARLASVTSGGATTTYGYDAAANQIATTHANGTAESRTFDRPGRLTHARTTRSAATLAVATYVLDPVGNPTSMTTGDGTTAYAYDALDRLTEACFVAACATGVDPFIRFTYDPVGNRLTEARAAGTTTYSYNPADQLTQTVGPTGTTVYAYDPNGNEVQAGARAFAYDGEHRLTRIVEPIAAGLERTIDYTYDGDGTRRSERIETDTLLGPSVEEIRYLWDPNAALPALALERDGAGATRRRYVHGADLISMETAGERFVYHHDGLGSAVALTDASGELEWSYAYEPFGATRKETRHQILGAPENRMRFTGEYHDGGSGLYHLRAREYDPGTGRFLRTDPLPQPGRNPYVSSYVYADNRPTVFTDPSGLRGGPSGTGFLDILNEMFTNPVQSFKAGLKSTPKWFWIADGILFLGSGGFIVCFYASATCAAAGSAAIGGTTQTVQRLGPIADQIPKNLIQQIALRTAQSGQVGRRIMEELADSPRLVANYGPGTWVKMQYVLRGADDKARVTVHWFRNLTTGQNVEYKFK